MCVSRPILRTLLLPNDALQPCKTSRASITSYAPRAITILAQDPLFSNISFSEIICSNRNHNTGTTDHNLVSLNAAKKCHAKCRRFKIQSKINRQSRWLSAITLKWRRILINYSAVVQSLWKIRIKAISSITVIITKHIHTLIIAFIYQHCNLTTIQSHSYINTDHRIHIIKTVRSRTSSSWTPSNNSRCVISRWTVILRRLH